MRVYIIIVAVGMWEKYTKSCIESIQKYEPDVRIVCVNNGNKITREQYAEVGNIRFVESEEILAYSKAINLGLKSVTDSNPESWYIVINNDVLCTKNFYELLLDMDGNSLYGNLLHASHRKFDWGHPWVDGWLFAFQNRFLQDVGYWDENFKTAAFEDADISYRAFENGYTVEKSYLPFIHLETHMRKGLEDFTGKRLENLNYLIEKHGLQGTGRNDIKCYLY